MKYWIFQNNQVLGPYEPNEMGKLSVFSPESLVCPEGRRGTSMGDWQRAGMVPDLSVALVQAHSGSGKTAVLSIAGLPPEPTLKDLAQLGSIQEKVALLEDVVLQLQEGLRAKDAELTSVHQELADKSLETSEIKGEAAARQNEAAELKRQIAGLEDRLVAVRLLSETLDKAVEEEKRVEHDVEKQGQTLSDLARDVEELRKQLEESKARPPEVSAPPQAAPFGESAPPPASFPAMPVPEASVANPFEPAQPATPSTAPEPVASEPSIPSTPVDFPTINAAATPAFDTSMPSMPDADTPSADVPSFDPMAFADPSAGALAPDATPEPDSMEPSVDAAAPPPAPKSKKGLLIGGVLGLVALGALAVMGGYVPGLSKPQAPTAVLEPTPLPPPEPEPAPVPVPDSRQLAVEFAKTWPLPGGRTLEQALEKLAPSTGNLSPWMADPLIGSRVQVNYFARSSAPGAPTIAYEFEVDLDGNSLISRNAAAKSVLTGKAAAPPAPPKPKPVRVKPKARPVKKAPPEVTLDSMLDQFGGDSTLSDPAGSPPAGSADIKESRPARANPARRAAKAKAEKAASSTPADESLLDDLLQE